MLQAHAIQTLQNEFESLRAQLANLKSKSSQPTGHAQPIQGLGSGEGPPRSFYGLSHDAMVREYVLSSAHTFGLTPEFTTFFYPSYFATQQAIVAPRVSTIRHVIQTNGLASGPSPITRAKGARVVMPQSFRPLNTKEECTTSSPLPIPDPHATGLPSNTLERPLISSPVTNGVRDLVISSSMAKLVGSPTSDSTFTYQKKVKNTSLVDLLLSKGAVDSHYLHKVSHSFPKVVPSERTSIAIRVTIVDNTESAIQMGGHTPKMVLLDIGAQLVFLEFNSPKRWACSIPNYENLCGKFALLVTT